MHPGCFYQATITYCGFAECRFNTIRGCGSVNDSGLPHHRAGVGQYVQAYPDAELHNVQYFGLVWRGSIDQALVMRSRHQRLVRACAGHEAVRVIAHRTRALWTYWFGRAPQKRPRRTRTSRLKQSDLDQSFAQIVIGKDRLGISIWIPRSDALGQSRNREVRPQMQEEGH